MYVRREGEEEGRENGRGRRFIRWAFDKRLRANQTAAFMVKLRQNINNAFYLRYNYAYVLVNNETGLRMVFYKQQKGSPWINNFAEAEIWLNEQENNRLTLDNIERPNTKWAFIKFSNIEVKAVIDNQPMLGTGPLPDLPTGEKWFRWILMEMTCAFGAALLFTKELDPIAALNQQGS